MTDENLSPRARKVALAPDLRAMDDRAARAWSERMAIRPLGGGRYAVDSQSGATYVVDVREGSCTCPDHVIRGERCKHLRRVAIEITAHRVPPPGKRAVACDVCGTDTFVAETADPPHLCAACHLEPGDRVVDRETGDWLIVSAVTDRRAEDVWIDSADCTVAEYPTNRGYPDDDLVVEVVYAGDAARTDRPRAYAFPISRLQRRDVAPLGEGGDSDDRDAPARRDDPLVLPGT